MKGSSSSSAANSPYQDLIDQYNRGLAAQSAGPDENLSAPLPEEESPSPEEVERIWQLLVNSATGG